MKIIKIVATRCQILRLKCTKYNFGSYSAPPDPLAGLRGLLLRGAEGTVRGGEGREGNGREAEGEWRGGDESPPFAPPNPYFWIRPSYTYLFHFPANSSNNGSSLGSETEVYTRGVYTP